MPTIKQLETALINADKAGDEAAARALAAEIKRLRAQQAQAPKPTTAAGKPSGRLGAFGAGIAEAIPRVIGAGLELFAPSGQKIATPEQERARQQQFAGARQVAPNFFTAGQITGEVLATAPVAGGVGKGIEKIGGAAVKYAPKAGPAAAAVARGGRVAQRVGRATQTGGIGSGRTAAQSAAMSRGARVGQLTERMAGGAIGGATGAVLTGQDATEGALFGAGLPVVGSVVKRIGGFAGDITKLPRQKAAEIIRKSLGDNVDAARAAFAQLSPDDRRLAEQVLVKAGIEPDTFFGIGQIAERELQPPGVNPMRAALEDQARARAQRLATAAGGTTATERRAGTELARQGVSEVTGPAREAALERANVAGRVVPTAEALADAARARADEMTASGFVPRMRGLEGRAREQIDAVFQNPEFFTESRPVVRAGEIAEGAGQRADDAIAAQLGLRQAARDMEDVVADLAAEGMQPLKVAPIVQQLRSMAGQPGTRADKLQRNTLIRLATDLEKLADANGVIDARDLYQIRKTGINDIVDRLLGARAQPSSGTKERTASLLTSIRPMIDEAIEGSGGAGWKDYLTRTRQGFEAVNRRELAGKAAQLADENAPEFIKLMEGQRPKIVEDIMGPGTKQYDIAGMALADPQRYLALKQSSDELAALNRMIELRGSGAGSAANLMIRERPSLMARGLAAATLSPFPAVRIGATGAEQVERAIMAPRVQREIAQAYTSGQAMGDILNTFPMQTRISERISSMSPMARNVFAQLLREYMTTPSNTYVE